MLIVLALALFGIVGNGLCLASIALQCPRWYQNPGLTIIFSLAVNDAVFCLQQGFTEIAGLLPRSMLPSFPPAVAYTIAAVVFGCETVENYHLILMAANRFVAIITPLRYATTFTPERTRLFCLFGWLTIVSYSVSYFVVCLPEYYSLSEGALVFHNGTDVYREQSNLCLLFEVAFVLLLLLCLCVPIAVYIPVTRALYWLQHNPASHTEIDVTLCVQFFLVMIIWFTCYAFFLFSLAAGFDNEYYGRVTSKILGLFIYTVNPVFYWIFNETIRNGFYALWKRGPQTVFKQRGT